MNTQGQDPAAVVALRAIGAAYQRQGEAMRLTLENSLAGALEPIDWTALRAAIEAMTVVVMPAVMTEEMERRWSEDFRAQCQRRRGKTRDAGGYRRARHPQSAEAYAYSGLVKLVAGGRGEIEPTEAMIEDACAMLVSEADNLFPDGVWPEGPDDDGDRGEGAHVRLLGQATQDDLRHAMRLALKAALDRRRP